jgi:NitT/TauT family transport system ATP-binding protein
MTATVEPRTTATGAVRADVRNLIVDFPSPRGGLIRALESVSFSVPDGQFHTIVGPSGCGKTTVLNVVAGLLRPTSGEVFVSGRSVSGPGRDRAMVFQEASLLPWRSVLDNIVFGVECQGGDKRQALREAQDLVRLVGLAGFEHHRPHELSGGMRQRVNLARALAVNPEILLMDEPFASLDAQTREYMQGELLRIWQEARRTVLFITHQISEAVYLSDRVLVFAAHPGRVVASIDIDVPRPRPLQIKRDPVLVDYERRIWDLIESNGNRGA